MEEQNSLCFTALVNYVQPELEELKRRFPICVDSDHNGKRFESIKRCKNVSNETRDVTFEYVHMDHQVSTYEVLTEMDSRGLRPALYEELLGFAEKYPDEQRKYPIVALGSEADVRGRCGVAHLWGGDDGRCLYLRWTVGGWWNNFRFLAVRE